MKIAVVSTDEIQVDDWFSNATRFLIYEIDKKDGSTLIGERHSEPLPAHFFDADMMNCVADIISDCERVYLANIKKKPALFLTRRGIQPVIYSGPILDIEFFTG